VLNVLVISCSVIKCRCYYYYTSAFNSIKEPPPTSTGALINNHRAGTHGSKGFRDRQKWPQAMRNETTMAMHESCKRNGNGSAMGVQCGCACPGAGHPLVLGVWRVLLVRQSLQPPAVGFAQLNRVWPANRIPPPQVTTKRNAGVQCCAMRGQREAHCASSGIIRPTGWSNQATSHEASPLSLPWSGVRSSRVLT
jgi:hypothetical protein